MLDAATGSVVKPPTAARNTVPPPTHKFTTDNLVTLDVGPSHHKIIVHKHSITRTSQFFAAALKKDWTEGQTRTLDLPEEIPEHMEYYCEYLYSDELPTKGFTHKKDGDNMEAGFELLANLYVFGERRMDTKLRNAVAHEMLRIQSLPLANPPGFGARIAPCVPCVPCVPSTATVNIIYQSTPEGSPARRLMVDMLIAFGNKTCHSSQVDRAFSFDVMEGFLGVLADKNRVVVDCRRVRQAKEYLI
jgi:hypothetical protein